MPMYCTECKRRTVTVTFVECEHSFCLVCVKHFEDCPVCYDPDHIMWHTIPAQRFPRFPPHEG